MSETGLKIKKFPDPVLRKKAKPVKKVSAEHAALLSKMSRLMYESKGIGLAAPQVGINEMMVVVNAGSGLYKLVNPKILKKEGSQVVDEGCLSVPGVYIKIKRAKKIMVSALDESSQPVKFEAQDLLACVIQHEIDHLYGRLIVDYASFLKKIAVGVKFKGLNKKAKDEKPYHGAL